MVKDHMQLIYAGGEPSVGTGSPQAQRLATSAVANETVENFQALEIRVVQDFSNLDGQLPVDILQGLWSRPRRSPGRREFAKQIDLFDDPGRLKVLQSLEFQLDSKPGSLICQPVPQP
jgi:hypothetical protein